MQKPLILGTIAIIILPLLALACTPQESTATTSTTFTGQTTVTTETTATTQTATTTETTKPVVTTTTTEPSENETETTAVPPLNGGEEAKTVTISVDEFGAENHIVKNIELTKPGSLIVTLGANPTTGYSWAASANISDPAVIGQDSHNYVTLNTGNNSVVGAPGKDVWVFNSLKAGTSNITFSYSRPWQGGEQNTWTLVLNVTVKEK
jgi:inhibitor of cysteine peptidase